MKTSPKLLMPTSTQNKGKYPFLSPSIQKSGLVAIDQVLFKFIDELLISLLYS